MLAIRLFFLSFFLLLHAGLFAQGATITGVVRSKHDGQALPFAVVQIKGTAKGAAADASGKFTLTKVEAGTHVLLCSIVGYEKREAALDVKAGETLTHNFEMSPLQHEEGEVVVTGTLRETYIHESPVKVEVVTWKQLQKIPTNNMMEALQTVNGVQEQLNCGVCATSDIHINGMEGPYTLVLIDGMPIMSALASVYGLNGIPTAIIDRIEVIKGPSSALYGTEAMAGVINVVTRRAENLPLFGFNSFGSTHGEGNADFFVAPKWKRASSLFSGNWYGMSTFIDENGDNFSDVVLAQRVSLFNKWSFTQKDNRRFGLSAKYYYEDRWGGERGWNKSFRGSDSIYGESIITKRAELLGNWPLPLKKQDVQLDFSFNHHDQDSRYGSTPYIAQQSTAFGNLVWRKQAGSRHQLAAGLQMRFQQYDDNTPATLNADDTWVPGAFVYDEMKLSERWKALPGLRLDYHDAHGLILSPRLNLKFDVTETIALRFNSGNGFRTVNLFTEDHAALTGSRTVVVRSQLQPERSWNFNLNGNGFFKTGKGLLNVDLDAFYSRYSNRILPDYASDQDLIIYDNLDGWSVTQGGAANISHSFRIPLKLSMGATYIDATVTERDAAGELITSPQVFAPKWSGVFTATWRIEKWKTSIDYTGRVVGPMALPEFEAPFTRAAVSPWFSLQNVQVTKHFGKYIEAFAAVKNLLDYTQESPLIDPQNPFGDNFDTSYAYGPMQGRRYVIGLRFRTIK